MAIAYKRVAFYPDKYETVIDVTLDGSYASGGYLLDPKQLGVIAIDHIDMNWSTGEGFTASFVVSTGKLKCWKNAAGAGAFTECVSGDLTASMIVRCCVKGRPIE